MLPIAKQDLEERIVSRLNGFVLIDGAAWEEFEEPIWKVSWFGDGGALVSPDVPTKGYRPYGYNAFQKELAEKEAGCEACGDIEVLIPEAVRRDPRREKLERAAGDAAKRESLLREKLIAAREENVKAQAALANYLDLTADAPWRCGT